MNTGTCDPTEANEYREIFKEQAKEFLAELDKWWADFGLKRQPSLSYVEGSEFLNVYLYPSALSYFRPEQIKPGKWFELQASVVRDAVEEKMKEFADSQKLPGKELLTDEFLAKPGKVVLFSLGTVVTRTIDVFKQIIPLLKDIPHKFVVAKGKFGDQIDLPDNCVGANYLDQLALLKDERVDLFVSHGGNNSFTEAVYFGKPMVIIPGLCVACLRERWRTLNLQSLKANLNLFPLQQHLVINWTMLPDWSISNWASVCILAT